MNRDTYITPSKITKQYNITSRTLVNLADAGKLRYLRPNENGRRVYHIEDVRAYFGDTTKKNKVCYARINSTVPEDQLETQVLLFKEKYPEIEIIKDIDSGINLKRDGFNKILEYIHKGEIDEIIVCSRDRICIIGYELFDWIIEKYNVKLTVINDNFIDVTEKQKELSHDLLVATKTLLKLKT